MKEPYLETNGVYSKLNKQKRVIRYLVLSNVLMFSVLIALYLSALFTNTHIKVGDVCLSCWEH